MDLEKCMGGIFYVKVDGEQISVSSDSMTVPLNNVTKTTQVSTSGVVGYTATRRAPYVECSIFITSDFNLEIFNKDNLTVTCEFADGKVYALNSAWIVNDIDLDGATGKTTVRFEGEKGGFV